MARSGRTCWAQSKGIVALAWGENGFRHMTNNKRSVNAPDDLKGLKMRTMENPVHMQAYKAFGIIPTPMAFTEVFTALQQGTVDGQENPLSVISAAKFVQVQKHITLTGHVYSPALILMSKAQWDKLSAADKQAFADAGLRVREAIERLDEGADGDDRVTQFEAITAIALVAFVVFQTGMVGADGVVFALQVGGQVVHLAA